MKNYRKITDDNKVNEIVKNNDKYNYKNNLISFFYNKRLITDIEIQEIEITEQTRLITSSSNSQYKFEPNKCIDNYKLSIEYVVLVNKTKRYEIFNYTVKDKQDAIYLYDIILKNIVLIKE